MANEGYHEPIAELTDETRDMHRAITSLMEELEAVDWYNQRVDACKDKELRAILAHNRDEEKEHAAMVLEWIRRQDPTFDKELRDFLFTDKPITHDSVGRRGEKMGVMASRWASGREDGRHFVTPVGQLRWPRYKLPGKFFKPDHSPKKKCRSTQGKAAFLF